MTTDPARASQPLLRLSMLGLLATLVLACGAPPKPAEPPPAAKKVAPPAPAPAATIEELFDVHLCATCHKGEVRFEKKDFNLAPELMEKSLAGRLSDQVEGMKLVEPGDPERSYLFHKLRGTHGDVGGFGRPMPSTSKKPTLSRQELEIARRWIENMKP